MLSWVQLGAVLSTAWWKLRLNQGCSCREYFPSGKWMKQEVSCNCEHSSLCEVGLQLTASALIVQEGWVLLLSWQERNTSLALCRTCPTPWMQQKSQTNWDCILFVTGTGTSRPPAPLVETGSMKDWTGCPISSETRNETINLPLPSFSTPPSYFLLFALRFTLMWQTVLLCGIECRKLFSFLLSQYILHHAVNVANTSQKTVRFLI